MFGYVYKITNTLNNKIYIGKREKSSLDENYWGSGKHIKYAIKKYGTDNFNREILEWCDTKDDLCEKETFYIKEFDATNPDIGYNIATNGWGGGFPHTEEWKTAHSGAGNGRYGKEVPQETRNKISEARKGKGTGPCPQKGRSGVKKPIGFGDKIRKARLGVKFSPEAKANWERSMKNCGWEKNKGKHIFNNGLIEIRLFDDQEIPDGFIRGRKSKGISRPNYAEGKHWYNNGEEEVFQYNCPEGYISGRLKKSIENFGKNDKKCGLNPRARRVQCIETNKIYDCIKDASEDTGLTDIGACCSGKISICKKNNTHWRYLDED